MTTPDAVMPITKKNELHQVLQWANAVGTAFLIYQATGIEHRFTMLEAQVAVLMSVVHIEQGRVAETVKSKSADTRR